MLGSLLVLALGALPAALADLVVVPYSDPRILYSGNWGDDIFELRTGLDPPGGGVNGTASPPACKLGDKSRTTPNVGDSFTFTFTGTAVALVTESRDDHGIFSVNVDGISSTVDGFSVAPHCGVSFSQDRLDLATSHTITVTLTQRNPASSFENTYLQIFSIRFDDGEQHSTSTTATAPGPSNSSGSGNGSGDQNGNGNGDPQSVGHSNTGAIVGGVVGGVLAGLALAALATFLFLRHRRRAGPPPHEHQELLAAKPWTPGQGPPGAGVGQNTTSFYNNATSYYPSEPSDLGGPTHTEVPFSAYPVSSAYPASSHGSMHRSNGSRAGGTLHDEDVERIAGRLAQLVQPGGSEWPASPPLPPLPPQAAPPPNSKAHYVARDPPAPRRDEDEPPPAY